MLGPRLFHFLNADGDLDTLGWNGPERPALWRYNQHYFDDLSAVGAVERRTWHYALMQDWLDCNPPASGTGWDSYPTSLRIVNWLKWQLAGNALSPAAASSMAMQARHLYGRLEWHLLGNHLLANAKALVFAGLAFDGLEAKRWLARGLDVLERELPEQILADGADFELSPMYQAIVLEDVLDMINAAVAWPGRVDPAVVDAWRGYAVRMLAWLRTMTHPDGGTSFFNDAALGIAPSAADLGGYAARLGLESVGGGQLTGQSGSGVTHLRDSGYVRLESEEAVALLDVARLGPDYLLGHAHADTLSFELSVFGHRVVVNGGTSRYGAGPERLAERGTASHSTVEVDGQDSSEVWSGFRVARRARPFGLELRSQGPECFVACSHDGYRRLPGRPVHRRTWLWGPTGLQVDDAVDGGCERAIARFILHPDSVVAPGLPRTWNVVLAGGRTIALEVKCGDPELVDARYAAEFGRIRPTRCLAVRLVAGRSQVMVSWR